MVSGLFGADQDGFGRRWTLAQSRMRAPGVVMHPPALDQDLLGDAHSAADLWRLHALAQEHLGLAQKADDLLGGVSLSAPSNLLVCGSE